ncbi:MAG TPA: hypothetical protein VNM39_13270 [Verrucomicrobiae bacterium]|nr:hypothetical protein [Verrucomicrobiae bacterium]
MSGFARVLERAQRRACQSAQRPYNFRGPLGGGMFGGSLTPPATGLTMWFNGMGSGKLFSDFAGTTPAVGPNARVARVDQVSPAPAGSWLTPNQTTQRGFRDPNGVDLQFGEPCYFAQPAGLAVPRNKSVWGFSCQNRGGGSSNPYLAVLFFDSTADIGVAFGNGQLFVYAAGVSHNSAIFIDSGVAYYGYVEYAPALVTVVVFIAGVQHNFSVAAVPTATPTANIFLGAVPAFLDYSQVGVTQFLAYDNTAGNVDKVGLLAFLKTQVAACPTTAPLVGVAGDSISQGTAATPQLSEFYAAQLALAGNATVPRLVNNGVPGYGLANITAVFPTVWTPLFSAARAKNILCVQAITNSMPCASGQEAATAAAVLTAYYAYCDNARAAGWKVIAFTCLPRSDAGAGTGFPGCWAIVNADLRANHALHSDDFADVSGVAGISLIADTTGPNYAADHLHLSDSGQVLSRSVVTPALQRVLAA